jgi:ParB-like chromosome segregation protein Spo0J
MSETRVESGMDNAVVPCSECIGIPPGNAAEETAAISGGVETTQIEAEVKEANLQATAKLVVDPSFQSLIRPLTASELAALTEDILLHGLRDPLAVWKGKNIILDGHHRYEICQKHGRSYQTVELEFSDEIEAKIWMLKNQRGRRNMNESQRAMAAVTLESLYSEQAKERMGVRTDLGQNLDPSEAGRSAEKAAREMGVSHQTVSFAKKVTTSGIPELKQMVEANKIAVSTASKVADLAEEKQKNVCSKIEAKAAKKVEDGKNSSRVTSSEVEQIIENLNRTKPKVKTTDQNIAMVEQRLKSTVKVLNGIDTTTQRETLSALLELAEEIVQKVKAIGLKSPAEEHEVEMPPSECQLETSAQLLKTFLGCIVSTKKGAKLRFDSDGLRIAEHNETKTFESSAFLPRGYFSKYELEPCEVCLRDVGELSRNLWTGKVQIFIEPETTYHHDRMMKIYSGYGDGGVMHEAQIRLAMPEFIREDIMELQLDPSCRAVVSISSKDFAGSLRDIPRTKVDREGKPRFAMYAAFSIEDSLLKIVAKENGSIQKISCNVIEQGEVDSKFDVYPLSEGDIGKMIEKADTITLGMGKDYPLIMDLVIGKMEVEYIITPLIEKDQPDGYELYRGVWCHSNGEPVLDEQGNPILEDQELPKDETQEEGGSTDTGEDGLEGSTANENAREEEPAEGQQPANEEPSENTPSDVTAEDGNL